MQNIIITLGDPYGIGPETTFKALKKIKAKAVAFTIIGDTHKFKQFGNLSANIEYIDIKSIHPEPSYPEPSKRGGDTSFKAVDKAITLMLKDKATALITAPISKEAWELAGVKYMGHTEVLRQRAGNPGALMMFKSGSITCALVTEHYAIKDLSKALTQTRIKDAAKILAQNFEEGALIEVSALNPHAGDGGKIGEEELKVIIPAIKVLQAQGLNIAGPIPVDALWLRHQQGKSKAILLMYHDAALLGLKLAAKEPVLHITAGLKFLRVSPTHGTAFDIAGTGKADESSMLAAIKYAIKERKVKTE